jgi:hypothetical protein
LKQTRVGKKSGCYHWNSNGERPLCWECFEKSESDKLGKSAPGRPAFSCKSGNPEVLCRCDSCKVWSQIWWKEHEEAATSQSPLSWIFTLVLETGFRVFQSHSQAIWLIFDTKRNLKICQLRLEHYIC